MAGAEVGTVCDEYEMGMSMRGERCKDEKRSNRSQGAG